MKIFNNVKKLENILNYQDKKYFNVPYGDSDYYSDYQAANRRAEKAEEKLKNLKSLQDIPTQVELGEKFPFTGYVGIDGETIKCRSCEHEKIVRDIIYDNPEIFKRYRLMPASAFDKKPAGMLQEEYYIMKYLGYVKISSFENAPLKRILFRYEKLTWMQSDIIYPQ